MLVDRGCVDGSQPCVLGRYLWPCEFDLAIIGCLEPTGNSHHALNQIYILSIEHKSQARCPSNHVIA